MNSALLLRATPALLEGWSGPAVFRFEGVDAAVTVVGFNPTSGMVAIAYVRNGFVEGQGVPVGDVYLDLARAECRARVARVVLHHTRSNDDAWPAWAFRVTPYDLFPLALGWGRGSDHDPIFKRYGLKRNDSARLPDGSRLVDAEALLAVAREVLHD